MPETTIDQPGRALSTARWDFPVGAPTLALREFGAGPPVVLLHGFTNYGLSWAPQLAAVVHAGHRVILPDLRGHGASTPATELCTVTDLAQDVIALLDHLGIGPVVVCGLSLGGMVGRQMALDEPDRIAGLVIANSRSSFTDAETTAMVDTWTGLLSGGRPAEAIACDLAGAHKSVLSRQQFWPRRISRMGPRFGDGGRIIVVSCRKRHDHVRPAATSRLDPRTFVDSFRGM